jgi:hypothetical protein
MHLIHLYYSLPTAFTSENINDLVAATTMDNGGPLPDPEGADLGGIPHDIFLVVTPPNYHISDFPSGTVGYHDEGNTGGLLDLDACQYGVVTSAHLSSVNNPLDSLTQILSHELVETITDPFSTSVLGYHSQQGIILSPDGEIADNEAQNHWGYANGVAVQSYWSDNDQAYIVPGGSSLQIITAADNILNRFNQGNVSVSGTGQNGNTISVTITDGTHTTTAATTTVRDGTWSVRGINASALSDGMVTYMVTATDADNNTTTITQTATKNTVVPSPATFVVTDRADASQAHSGSDDPTDSNGLVSLRSAIAAANFDAGLGGSVTISFAASLDGTTLTLTQGQLELTAASGNGNGTVTIVDSGARGVTIDGNQLGRVFEVDAGAYAVLNNLGIVHGLVTGIYAQGGGIFNAGSLTLINDGIDSNRAAGLTGSDGNGTDAEGGGIYNAASGVLMLTNTTIYDNFAVGGAGGAGLAGIDLAGTNGTHGGNGGRGLGGGIYNDGGEVRHRA